MIYGEWYIETKVNIDLNIYFSAGKEMKMKEGFSLKFYY